MHQPQQRQVASSTNQPQYQQRQITAAPLQSEQNTGHRVRAAVSAAKAKDAKAMAVAAAVKAEAALRKAEAAARVATAAASTAVAQAPLPKDWATAKDPASGRTYYFNKKTGAAQWRKPSDNGVAPRSQAMAPSPPAPSFVPPRSDAAAQAPALSEDFEKEVATMEQNTAHPIDAAAMPDTDPALPVTEEDAPLTSHSSSSQIDDDNKIDAAIDTGSQEVDAALADVNKEEKELNEEEASIGDMDSSSSTPASEDSIVDAELEDSSFSSP